VCTDIIHYQNRQLRRYKGNLSEFVKAVPTAKSYYELEAATLKFRFPVPGLLDGITSKEKPICKLSNVAFSYPGGCLGKGEHVACTGGLSAAGGWDGGEGRVEVDREARCAQGRGKRGGHAWQVVCSQLGLDVYHAAQALAGIHLVFLLPSAS
jgi:hypothetical protein